MARSDKAPAKWIAAGAGAVVVTGLILWLTLRRSGVDLDEQQDAITLVCASCGNAVKAAFRELPDLARDAQAKGFTDVGTHPRAPAAACPKCNKATMFVGTPCPKCGKPIVGRPVDYEGKQYDPECKACGWKPEQEPDEPPT